MPSLLTKDFNLVANQYTSYLTYEECSPNLTYVPNPSTDRYCIIGFDLAERNDLNAAVAIFRRPGEDFMYEKAMFWLAEEQLGLENSNQKQRDGVPYLKWQSDGLIRIMQGSKINQRVVVDWIKELYEEGLYPMAIAFDKWHVDDWTLRELEGMVGSKNLHPVQPWAKEISQAMKEHKIDLHTDSINDNDNSILHWCRGNVQARTDDSNNVWPLKKGLKPENRIDGYMAEIYAYIAYKKHEESYLSMIGEDPNRVMSLGSKEIVIPQ
jgi:phage terminase large subunit-like protein